MHFQVTSHNALVLASSLPGVELLYRKQGEAEPTKMGPDQAYQLVKNGEGQRVYAELTEGRANALLEKVAQYQVAYDEMESQAENITRKVASDRAAFIRQTAAQFVGTWTRDQPPGEPIPPEVIEKAVTAATALDQSLWDSMGETEEG